MSSPPEPSRRGDTAPGSTGGGWMQGPRGVGGRGEGQHGPAWDPTAAMGTFPSWLEGGSGAKSQARREGSLSIPVTEAGHPDGGQKGRPRKTPYSSAWAMPLSSGHPAQMPPAVRSAGPPAPTEASPAPTEAPPAPTEASPAPCSPLASSGLCFPLEANAPPPDTHRRKKGSRCRPDF